MDEITNHLRQIGASNSRISTVSKPRITGDIKNSSPSFNQILKENLHKDEIIFSKHASSRMMQRNIKLSQNEIDSIKQVIEKASHKGVRDSLVLMKNIAFIINVPSRTVVTAVDEENMKNNVFTNIDGAVII